MGSVELLRVRILIAERNCGLWGALGTQRTLAAPRRMSPYPSPYASPRVRYTNLELDSDLSFGKW